MSWKKNQRNITVIYTWVMVCYMYTLPHQYVTQQVISDKTLVYLKFSSTNRKYTLFKNLSDNKAYYHLLRVNTS